VPTADPSPISPPPTRCDWNAEYSALTAADRASGLSAEELERLAVATFLLGLDDEVVGYRDRADRQYLDRGLRAQALRSGFWLDFICRTEANARRRPAGRRGCGGWWMTGRTAISPPC
jgi:hypothetical protein